MVRSNCRGECCAVRFEILGRMFDTGRLKQHRKEMAKRRVGASLYAY